MWEGNAKIKIFLSDLEERFDERLDGLYNEIQSVKETLDYLDSDVHDLKETALSSDNINDVKERFNADINDLRERVDAIS